VTGTPKDGKDFNLQILTHTHTHTHMQAAYLLMTNICVS
jgi:hypothetical protein